ncbi:MAG: YciI family protein [Opitutaceae bacterium]|nr:YciI family protein [Opitutaceae bacterium]
MLYTLLIYLDEKQFASLPAAEQNRVHQACGAWHEELVRSGHSRGANGLQPSALTATLRERDGRVVVTDGPFAETREILGGFELLECKDRTEAIAIARRFPALQAGATLELRPNVIGNECRAG